MAQERRDLIPPEEWGAFFEALSDEARGLRAWVEAAAEGGAPQLVARDAPFAGIIDGAEGIVIELAGGLSYNAGLPRDVRRTLAPGGRGQTISFETSAGQRTLLHLAGGEDRSQAIGAIEGDDQAGVGGSAGAAGGLVSFGRSDDMGGVAEAPGGSLGDRDLSGRGAYDISGDVYDGPSPDLGRLPSGALDGGSGQGLIDTGIDPIEGGPAAPGADADDGMVEGEVGPQAERDLTELFGRKPRRPGDGRDER